MSCAFRWSLLLGLSGLLAWALHQARLPAYLLLGPMLAGILMALANTRLCVPSGIFQPAKGILGCMIASTFSPGTFAQVGTHWLLLLCITLGVIALSISLGWLLARLQVMPGVTALWGTSAGAALVMTVLAESYGADFRLVAFMQYSRVLVIALLAALIAHCFALSTPGQTVMATWMQAPHWPSLGIAFVLIGMGLLVGHYARSSAASMMLPLFAGIALQASGWVQMQLPPFLLTACFVLIGWRVGLGFTADALAYAARALPRILVSILALVGLCALLAWILHVTAGVPALTAFLATSPGGIDTVAIIALSGGADVPYVMAFQATRLVLVLLINPPLARFLSARIMRTVPGTPLARPTATAQTGQND